MHFAVASQKHFKIITSNIFLRAWLKLDHRTRQLTQEGMQAQMEDL